MIIKGDFLRLDDTVVFSARCSHCGAPVGDLTGQEVSALLSGKWGPVLCFDCEDKTCPTCGYVMVDPRGLDDIQRFGECMFCHWDRLEKIRIEAKNGK